MTIYPIIFVVDTSGSMSGYKITMINESLYHFKNIYDNCNLQDDVQVNFGILTFSTGSEWMTEVCSPVQEMEMPELVAAGVTSLGAALKELEETLCREKLGLEDNTRCGRPVIVFMTDGYPNDDWEYRYKCATENNVWFRRSSKISVGFGGDIDREVLLKLAQSCEEAVIIIEDEKRLSAYIQELFYAVCSDGVSSLLEAGTEKAARISRTTKDAVGDDESIFNDEDEWD